MSHVKDRRAAATAATICFAGTMSIAATAVPRTAFTVGLGDGLAPLLGRGVRPDAAVGTMDFIGTTADGSR